MFQFIDAGSRAGQQGRGASLRRVAHDMIGSREKERDHGRKEGEELVLEELMDSSRPSFTLPYLLRSGFTFPTLHLALKSSVD